MNTSYLKNGFSFLVLLLFCAVAIALPACSTLPSAGHASLLVGLSDTQWGDRELQAESRVEQTLWTQGRTRLAGSTRLLGSLGDNTDIDGVAGVRLEQGAVGFDILMGSDHRLLGMDYSWHPLDWLKLKMGLQHEGELIQAHTGIEVNMNDNWAIMGEFQSSEKAQANLIGLRGRW